MTRTDFGFLALIILGLFLGLGYVLIGYGWHDAMLYGGLVCFGAGLIGGFRK